MGQELSSLTINRDMPALLPLTDAALTATEHPVIAIVAAWVKDYLCRPHQDLGRNGPMCPFVPGALQKELLFVASYDRAGLDMPAIREILLAEMERFIDLPPTSGNEAQFKSLMVLFPQLSVDDAIALIETAQAELQPRFVPNGLMVGEFHGGPPRKTGLWNTDFRPLYSPVPMLVIRHMVPTDVLFLKDDPRLFAEYIKIYGNAVPERFRAQFEEASARFGMASASSSDTPQGAPRIIGALEMAELPYRVHCHDDFPQPIRNPNDFAEALGYAVARITKTLFLRCRDSGRHCLVVCGMDKRIDLRGISTRLGAGRLEMAPLTDLQKHVGYPPTSVTPIAVSGIPVFIDQSLMEHATVLTGSGVPRVEIEISPADLRALCDARVVAMA
jgi:Cys-tRNA(Pro) deacylase